VETAEARRIRRPRRSLLTERSQTVRKIAVFLPVTDEQLEDESEARSYIDNRLVFMLRSGSTRRRSSVTATHRTCSAPRTCRASRRRRSAPTRSSTRVEAVPQDPGQRVRGAVGGFIAPSKWQTVALTRTADGLYILGNPATQAPSGCGASRDRRRRGHLDEAHGRRLHELRGPLRPPGVDVQVGYNNDDFIKGQLSIRADVRVAVVHFRPKAFGTVTGL
jgi:hypothetical protein